MNAKMPVPQLLLEQLALGVLSEEERTQVCATLAEAGFDPEDVIEDLLSQNDAILNDLPPAHFADTVRRRQRKEVEGPQRFARLKLASVPIAATLLLGIAYLVFPFGSPPSPFNPDLDDTVRFKCSAPRLSVYHQSDTGLATPLNHGDIAYSGDVLQLTTLACQAHHGVVFSIDGRGALTLHFPAVPNAATDLPTDGEVALPHGYALDDAPDFERFVFLTSDHPIDTLPLLTEIQDWLDSGGDAQHDMLSLSQWPELSLRSSILVLKDSAR